MLLRIGAAKHTWEVKHTLTCINIVEHSSNNGADQAGVRMEEWAKFLRLGLRWRNLGTPINSHICMVVFFGGGRRSKVAARIKTHVNSVIR
jgi:hypothetical protein